MDKKPASAHPRGIPLVVLGAELDALSVKPGGVVKLNRGMHAMERARAKQVAEHRTARDSR